MLRGQRYVSSGLYSDLLVDHMTPVVLVLWTLGHVMSAYAFCQSRGHDRLASAVKAELVLHPERFVPLVTLKGPYLKFWRRILLQSMHRGSLEANLASH